MQISWVLKQMQQFDWWAPEGLDTLPVFSNANDAIKSFFGPEIKYKDGFDAF